MSKLFACSFEGGILPTGVTLSNATPRPGVGYNGYWKWAAVGSFSANQQAQASFALGSSKTAIWVSFRLRAADLNFTSPAAVFDFGMVSLTFTSSTNLRLSYDGTDVDKTIATLDGDYHTLSVFVDLSSTTTGIAVTYDDAVITEFSIDTSGGAIGGSDDTLILRGLMGKGSCLDDIRVDDDGTAGTTPSLVEGHKCLAEGVLENSWAAMGTVSNINVADALGMAFNPANNLFYYIDSNGQIKTWAVDTGATTSRGSAQTDAAHGAMAYHQGLDRVYFIADGTVQYMDASFVITDTSTTAYYDGDTNYASGSAYNAKDGKAYLVSLAATATGANAINIHIIDEDGTVSVVSSSASSAINAVTDVHLPLVYDDVNEKLIFPLFDRNTAGIVNSSDSFLESSPDGSAVVIGIFPAPPSIASTGSYLAVSYEGAATSPTTSALRLFDASSNTFAALGSVLYTAANGSGLAQSGLCAHPYIGHIFSRYAAFAYAQLSADSLSPLKVVAWTLPGTDTKFTGRVNPLTNGTFVVSGGSLYEWRMTPGENSIQYRDSSFLQRGRDGGRLSPSFATPFSGSTHGANAMLGRSSGIGSITLRGETIALDGTAKDRVFTILDDTPDLLYDFGSLQNNSKNHGSDSGATVAMPSMYNGLIKFPHRVCKGGTGNVSGIPQVTTSKITKYSGDFSFMATWYLEIRSTTNKLYITDDLYLEDYSGLLKLILNDDELSVTISTRKPFSLFVGRTGSTINYRVNGKLIGSITSSDELDVGNPIKGTCTYRNALLSALVYYDKYRELDFGCPSPAGTLTLEKA